MARTLNSQSCTCYFYLLKEILASFCLPPSSVDFAFVYVSIMLHYVVTRKPDQFFSPTKMRTLLSQGLGLPQHSPSVSHLRKTQNPGWFYFRHSLLCILGKSLFFLNCRMKKLNHISPVDPFWIYFSKIQFNWTNAFFWLPTVCWAWELVHVITCKHWKVKWVRVLRKNS